MLTPFDYAIWIAGALLYFCAALLAIRNGEFKRHLGVNVYLLSSVAATIGEWVIFHRYGFYSVQYLYFFYYVESLLSVLLYFVVVGFYQELLDEMGASQMIRLATVLVLSATAVATFAIVEAHRDHMISRFVVELGRNLNFIGGVLTYILLLAMAKVPSSSRRLLQMVSALGIYFCVLSLAYGVRMFHPEWRIVRILPQVTSLWIAAAWAYAFAKPATVQQIVGQSAPALDGRLSES
jgi:hypothetical protein